MKFPNWLTVAGDISYRGECPSETVEQVTLFNQIRKHYPEIGRIMVHIRNEGERHYRKMQKEKAEGLVTGAADIFIPGNPCVVIEMKRKDHTKSRLSTEQAKYLKACNENGAVVFLSLGWEAAFKKIEEIYGKDFCEE